jgi:hypothetical protein
LPKHETSFDKLPAVQFLNIVKFAPHEHGVQTVPLP